jgi:hypothetical protein
MNLIPWRPDPTKCLHLGAGGWGNAEAQSHTNAADNVIVAGGNLKITAKKSRFKLHISTIKI